MGFVLIDDASQQAVTIYDYIGYDMHASARAIAAFCRAESFNDDLKMRAIASAEYEMAETFQLTHAAQLSPLTRMKRRLYSLPVDPYTLVETSNGAPDTRNPPRKRRPANTPCSRPA